MGRKRVLHYYDGKLKGEFLSDEDCSTLDKVRQLSLKNGYVKDLKKCIYDLPPSDIELIKASRDGDIVVDKNIGTLEDVQTCGVAFMFYAKRMVLGDSVGMGKTVELCGLFNLLTQKRAKEGYDFHFLYLTEKNLVSQTRDKLIQFTGEYVEAVYGDKKSIDNFLKEATSTQMNVVASHSVVKSIPFQDYLVQNYKDFGTTTYDILVIDESAVLSNRKTQMYEAAKFLADMFEYVIILNATPFEKNLSMYYNQIHFVDDTLLPTLTDFNKKYVEYDYRGPYPKPNGKYKHADEFQNLVAYRYFARTRKSTGAVMKDCTAEVFISDLSPEQKELLKRTSIPMMVYDCPSYFFRPGEFDMTIENTPKLRDLLRIVSNLSDQGESILIYSAYKEAQKAIQSLLFGYGIECYIMNGDTKIEEKNTLIDKFKANEIKVLITNVQKGLDFAHCNHCIFYSYDASPNKMVQFEGRMTREYNIIDKHVYLLISRGRELNKFKSIVKDRAVASDMFAGSDFSCVLSLLLDQSKIDKLS